MSYKIAVIGTGYVGLVSGTCFAATGNDVLCVDIDKEKISKMQQGISPIYEPGLEHLLKQNIKEERLHFTTDLKTAVEFASIIFLCLPTPPNEDGSADLNHVKRVAAEIANLIKENNLNENKIVINKSTVPVGTVDKVRSIFDEILTKHNVTVVSNPEFLREGFAVEDAMKPERVVIGTSSEYAKEILNDLYKPFVRSGNPIFFMDEKSAEITKYAANAFLATKISFMNDLSAYCEKVGADIENIRMGIGSDSRIGKRFLFAGVGYGGSCFPKDVRALIYSAEKENVSLDIVKAAWSINAKQINRFFDRILSRFGNDLKGKKIGIWGLAFKPNTDDTREAPAFTLIDRFLEEGASVTAYDPEAEFNTRQKFGDSIKYAKNMYDCVDGVDVLVIATEWTTFRNPDFNKMKNLMKNNLIFDGRNLYTNDEMQTVGFEYHCIGRNSVIL